MAGTIYLVHFSERYRHAAHYLGYTTNLDERLRAHNCGTGARLMEVITNAGIDWELARTWKGTRKDERRLKNRGGHARICPICKAKGKAS